MGGQLHQALKSLCCNTGWKYAAFWKLKHRAHMMLTWEDAYFDTLDPQGSSRWFCDTRGNFHDCQYSHEKLSLALAKMSRHVYSQGEGIVGLVAATGKHLWLSKDTSIISSCSPAEYTHIWEAQFLAGIKTIAIVAVRQCGVVLLGSLNKMDENLKFVNHVRDIFSGIQDALSEISTSRSGSRDFHDCPGNIDEYMIMYQKDIWAPMSSPHRKPGDQSFCVLPGSYPKRTVENKKLCRHAYSLSEEGQSVNSLGSCTKNLILEQTKAQNEWFKSEKCEKQIGDLKEHGVGSGKYDTISLQNSFESSVSLNKPVPTSDNLAVGVSHFPTDQFNNSTNFNQEAMLCVSKHSNTQIQIDLEKSLECKTDFNCIDTLSTSYRFSSGCELYEALGPAFQKQSNNSDWSMEKSESETPIDMPEGTYSCSLLTSNMGSEHLLEAVVANVCSSGSDVTSGHSFCISGESYACYEKVSETFLADICTSSAGYSLVRPLLEDTLQCLKSTSGCSASTSKGFSPSSLDRCSEKLERPQEPAKTNKKRAKPGENHRPRPRDRQLIQDRIKELRELVPNGAKCSIDSLLERTIKHMIFMQSITKNADKLHRFGESKLLDKEKVVQVTSGSDQGSSWAVEVGSHLSVCPIIVENINMNGLMLVEMLCEDCSHFLEITEAIRGLGLTILKGVTDAYGEKTWMCFVVEGQHNRSIHRIDVLWSLVQILQSRQN